MRRIILFITICLFFFPTTVKASVFYVRTDGGTGTECTGLADAAYDGDGTGEACAFSHPFYALGWCSNDNGDCYDNGTLGNGDTLIVVNGSYNMGYSSSWSGCNSAFTYGCVSDQIPSNVTITGCSSSGCGSSTRPILWAGGHALQILAVRDSSGVTIQDIELTDHETCGNNHPTLICTSGEDSLNARDGISADGASSLTLTNILIHGVYRYGIIGGSGSNLTMSNVELYGNAYAGFTNDTTGTCANCGISGTNNISDLKIRYSGCVEEYPINGTLGSSNSIEEDGCWDQNETGYGDGWGFAATGGIWNFTDCEFSYNSSDGLDAIYHNKSAYAGTSLITLKRCLGEGNVGAAFKLDNHSSIEDSIAIGNCSYLEGQDFSRSTIVACRGGATVGFEWHDEVTPYPKIINSTILSNMDVAIMGSGSDQTCTSSQEVYVYNSILLGGYDHNDPGTLSGVYYVDPNCPATLVEDYNVCYDFKDTNTYCTGVHDDLTDPLFDGTIKLNSENFPNYYTTEGYVNEIDLASNSPAIDAADETVTGADAYDYTEASRGASWDIGAIEYGSTLDEEEEDDTPTISGGCAISSGVGFE